MIFEPEEIEEENTGDNTSFAIVSTSIKGQLLIELKDLDQDQAIDICREWNNQRTEEEKSKYISFQVKSETELINEGLL